MADATGGGGARLVLADFFGANVLYCGDNLHRLSHYIPDESVDLVYLDHRPPEASRIRV